MPLLYLLIIFSRLVFLSSKCLCILEAFECFLNQMMKEVLYFTQWKRKTKNMEPFTDWYYDYGQSYSMRKANKVTAEKAHTLTSLSELLSSCWTFFYSQETGQTFLS